ISGIYDVSDLAQHGSGQKSVPRVFGAGEAAWSRASPINHLGRSPVPRIMLAIGDEDAPVLIRQYESMKRALEGHGAHPTAVEVSDRTHISILTELLSEGDPLGEEILRFMQAL